MRATLDQLDAMAKVGGAEASRERLADLVAVPEVCAEIKRLALSDLPRAMILSEFLASLAGDDDPDGHHVYAARAHVLSYAGRLDDALAAQARALTSAKRHGAARDVGLVELASVQALARSGRLSEALACAERAADLLRDPSDTPSRGKALLNAGIVLRMLGKTEEALARFDASATLLAGDDLSSGAVMSNRAEALLDLDRFDQAADAFAAALERFERGDHRHAAAIVQGNLADLLSRQGRLDEALPAFERARTLYESCSATADAARLAAEQAEAFETAGAYDAAIRGYAEALAVLRTVSLARESARAAAGLGRAMLAAGMPREGADMLRQAVADLAAIGATDAAAESSALVLASRVRAGEIVASAELDPPGLDDRPVRQARARAEVAEALLDAGRLDDAERLVMSLCAAESAWSNAPLRARAAHLRGRVMLAHGRAAAASEELRRAVMLAESVRGTLRGDALRSSWGEARRAVYQDCAIACLDEGSATSVDLAFDAIERMRCRGVARGSSLTPSNADARLRELASITQELNVYYADLGGRSAKAVDAAELRAKIASLESAAQRLRDRLEASGDGAAAKVSVLPLEAVRADLPADAAGLSFFREGDSLSCLMVSREGVVVMRRMAREADVRAALRRARYCVERLLVDGTPRDHDGLNASLRTLASLVVEPLHPTLRRAASIAISAPAWLGDVPWAALPFDGRLVIEQLTPAHVWGLSSVVHLARAPRAHGPLLAVGVADQLAPAMEREAMLTAATRPDGVALTGDAATAERVLRELHRCSTAHLATHFEFSSMFALSSRVRLHDRWVTAREIARAVRPGCELTLASCESGRGGASEDEGSHAMIGVLMDAGVRAVAATRWRLHDDTALEMFPRVHASTTAGLAHRVAMAQRDMHAGGCPVWRGGGVFVSGGLS